MGVHHGYKMTKRREVYFEYESVTDKPTKAEIEVLCSRAARLSYLSPFELTQAINEHTQVTINRLSKLTSLTSTADINWKGFTSRTTRGGIIARSISSRISIRSANINNIVSPLLRIIQGSIIIYDNSDTGCQVYIFQVFDEIWISFRGTQLGSLESIKKDLLTDLKFKQRQATYLTEKSRVHTGFDASYMSVRQELWTEIEKRFVLEGERPLRIIGHSLGGALASLMALDFYLNFNIPGVKSCLSYGIPVRTYGCPCMGNKAFVDLFNKSIIDTKRYVIYMDPVPLLLSEISAFGYFHTLEKVEVNEIRRKHNVENYIKVLCKWAHVDDDIEEEIEDIVDIEEEDILHEKNRSNERSCLNLLIVGSALLFISLLFYR